MKIILSNNMELNPIIVMGEKRYIFGTNRDTLSFVFPASMALDEVDALFNEVNCEKIVVADDNGEYRHNGYTVRAELKRTPVEVAPATEDSDAVYENRVIVSMAQRTYQENQINEMQRALAALAGMEG